MRLDGYNVVGFAVMGALLCCATSVVAGEFYVGGGAGLTTADFGDSSRQQDGFSFDIDADEEDSGFKIFGGYLFNEYVGVEVAYVDLGEYDADIEASGLGVTGSGDSTAEISGVSIVGVLGKDLTEVFRIFGKLGIYIAEQDITSRFTATAGGETETFRDSSSDDGTELTAGGGVQWAVAEPVSIRAEAEYYDAGDDYFLFSLGALLTFGKGE